MDYDVKKRKVWKWMKCQKKEKYFHQKSHDEKCISDLILDQDKGNPWHQQHSQEKYIEWNEGEICGNYKDAREDNTHNQRL